MWDQTSYGSTIETIWLAVTKAIAEFDNKRHEWEKESPYKDIRVGKPSPIQNPDDRNLFESFSRNEIAAILR